MRFFDKHAQRDKHLLRLERELDRLYQAQRHAPVISLEHPYQRGWVKTYVLREDALHHPEVLAFQALLPVVNERVYSRHRDFRRHNGQEILLRPRVIRPHEWHRRAWPIRYHQWFSYGRWPVRELPDWLRHGRREYVIGFRLTRAWWLEEEVLPHMITHQRVELPSVRSRIAHIEAHLVATQGGHRLAWLHGQRSWWDSPKSAATHRAAASLADQCE